MSDEPRAQPESRKLDLLLLCSGASVHIGTVIDHIEAFASRSQHNITPVDATYCSESGIDLSQFDVVVFHYSVVLSDPSHIRPSLAARIKAFDGLKVAFIQDEYRWIDRQNAAIEDFGISVLYTVTNPEVTRRIYRTPYFDTIRIEHTLTGFVPESLLDVVVPDYTSRPIDVSYRARRSPAWYGKFAEEKFTIGEKFLCDATDSGLVCDIEWAESRRIYGDDWIKFVSSSKATLGTESGVSFIDFTGDVQAKAEAFERENPEACPASIREQFLGNLDGQITIQVISPRVFEAAALRTLLVLYPGRYSNVLLAGRHFVQLEHDHSNFSEVLSIIRSPEKARPIIDRAYEEVACNPAWWLGTLVQTFDVIVAEEFEKHVRTTPAPPSRRVRVAAELTRHWRTREMTDHTVAQLETYKATHDFVAAEYSNLAREHQGLIGSYQTLVGHHQHLAEAYQKLALDHQQLALDHQSLGEEYRAYKFVGLKEHIRRAASAIVKRIAVILRDLAS